jgi:UDP-glucose 4-epimerase
MTHLVLGGLGFAGSHLCDLLISQGKDVCIVDNLSSNAVSPEHFAGRCRVEVCDLEQYCAQVDPAGLSYIFYLAGVVGPSRVIKYGGRLAEMLILQNRRALDLALRARARYIYISTSEVYGYPGRHGEKAPAQVTPGADFRSEYGLGKLVAEKVIANTARAEGLRFQILRPFNMAGPRQRTTGGFVLPRFVHAALAGRPIEVFHPGSQRRAFTHVADAVAAILFVASNDSLLDQTWNIGNEDNVTTVQALAQMVKEYSGSSSAITLVDPKSIFGPEYSEAYEKIPDATKLRNHGWQPRFSLQETVQQFIDSVRIAPGTDPPLPDISA